MKIEHLKIKEYKQFKDLKLNLTYPKGHKKEREPLDKICIIGQSGIGKSTLLEIIVGDFNHISHFFTEKSNITIQYNRNMLIRFDKATETTKEFKKKQKHETVYFTDVLNKENDEIWTVLKDRIDNYDTDRLEHLNRLSDKLLNIDNYEKKNFKQDIERWEEKNSNILEKITAKINETLIHFNLELTKIYKNQQSYKKLSFKDLSNGNILRYDSLSKGTKNFLSTLIPLKSYSPKESIILIDEVENSIHPNIQKDLVEIYTQAGENNQLIMTTHSSLIASSFEPWEIVELKFDENNQVYRELYYQGENRIENYTLEPEIFK